MVIAQSAPVAAALGEGAALAPASTSDCTARASRSNTLSAWPAFSRLRAIGAPMLPSPIKAIFMRGLRMVAQRRLMVVLTPPASNASSNQRAVTVFVCV